MIHVEVKVEDAGLAAELRGLKEDLRGRTEMYESIAAGAGDAVRGHLEKRSGG